MEYFPHHLSTLNSTNSYARQLLKEENAEENTVILTDYQDNGKGQGENSWISDKGMNLLMSWIVYPAFLTVSDQFMLSKAVSLGIIDTLEELGLDVQIKWPNDIICRNGKLGGILIENSIQGGQLKNSIIGIGLNVNQREFPSFPFPATSITSESTRLVAVSEAEILLMPRLLQRYTQLKSGKNDILNSSYLDKLFRRNIISEFEADGERFEGEIRGVNEFGELVMDVSGNLRYFGFHAIRMVH